MSRIRNRIYALLGALVVLQPALLAKDKEKPNLSGDYVLTPSRASKHGGESPTTHQLRIAQDDRVIEMMYIEGDKVRKCAYNLDGSESQNFTSGGSSSRDRAQFKGGALIIRSVVPGQNGTTFNTTETWRLSRDSKRLSIHFSAQAGSGMIAGFELASSDNAYVRE